VARAILTVEKANLVKPATKSLHRAVSPGFEGSSEVESERPERPVRPPDSDRQEPPSS